MNNHQHKILKFIPMMKEVLEDERSVILTDKELLIAVNQKLDLNDRVSLSCFEFWKTPIENNIN